MKFHETLATAAASILLALTLTSCSSIPRGDKVATSAASTDSRHPATTELTTTPLRIILIGHKSEMIQHIQSLSQMACVLQGARDRETAGLEKRTPDGGIDLGWDHDGNGYINDRYGWTISHDFNGPASSLVTQLNLAGEWLFFVSHGEPTSCAVIFTIFLDDNSRVNQAIRYLGASSVWSFYKGPVEVHYSNDIPGLREGILKFWADKKVADYVTTFSLIPF